MSFENANVAGAAITLDVIKCDASAPNSIYAAKTVPLTVANPDDIITWISEAVKYYKHKVDHLELVIIFQKYSIFQMLTFMYGLIINGDSVIPRKMLAATITLSHIVVPRIDCSNQPIRCIIHCMAP